MSEPPGPAHPPARPADLKVGTSVVGPHPHGSAFIVLDPDPGAWIMDIEQNLQTALVSCFSKRLSYLHRHVFLPFNRFGSCIRIWIRIKTDADLQYRSEPFKENRRGFTTRSIDFYWKFCSCVDCQLLLPVHFLTQTDCWPSTPLPNQCYGFGMIFFGSLPRSYFSVGFGLISESYIKFFIIFFLGINFTFVLPSCIL